MNSIGVWDYQLSETASRLFPLNTVSDKSIFLAASRCLPKFNQLRNFREIVCDRHLQRNVHPKNVLRVPRNYSNANSRTSWLPPCGISFICLKVKISLFLSDQICHIMMATIGNPKTRAQNIRPHKVKSCFTDTSLLRTDCFVPEERKPLHFQYKVSTRLTYNTDSFYGPLNVHIIGVSPYSCHA